MPTRLIQLEQHASGTAAFQVTGPGAAQLAFPQDLELSIVQPGPTERYLDPRNPDDPWTTSVYRFRPLSPRRQGPALWLEIDYGVTYHLRANQPYKLRIRQFEGLEIEEVFTGPSAMRRPSARPQGWTPPPDPKGPVSVPAPPPATEVAPPIEAAPEPPPEPAWDPEPIAEPMVEPVLEPAEPEFAPPIDEPIQAPAVVPQPGRRWVLPLVVLLGLITGIGGYFAFASHSPPPVVESMDSVRKFIAGNPEPVAARIKADALAKSGKLLDGQFLLYKYAGEKGDRDAARTMGAFYDPDTWAQDKSPLPAPNPLEAARWHKQAAEAGDAEAQYRYGMLLKEGRTDAPDGPEQGLVWLRKAAEQGHAKAKEALPK
jgi:hypothetical protein